MFICVVLFVYLILLSILYAKRPNDVNTNSMLRGGKASVTLTMSGRVESEVTKKLSIPYLLYGTAWKKDRTADLVVEAIRQGFRGIDTACQPKHYNEAGVGKALKDLFDEGFVTRGDLFVQTKFTPVDGQDPLNIPYDRTATLVDQVKQSFAKSCSNIGTNYLDSLLLHSPLRSFDDTITVWRTFEEIYHSGGVRALGISNTYDLNIFQRLYEQAEVKPSFLQNRFYSQTGYDKELRQYCREKGVVYQSFWTLTANPNILSNPILKQLSEKYEKTAPQLFFRFLHSIGVVPLTGTTSIRHMQEDLDSMNIDLSEEDAEAIYGLLR